MVPELGILIDERGVLKPANPIYAETIGRYLTRGTQSNVMMKLPENHLTKPWEEKIGTDEVTFDGKTIHEVKC